MDVVGAAAGVVRQSRDVLEVAAGELAKGATSVAQLAAAKDPIAWLAGDDEEDDDEDVDAPRPPAPLAVPLAALQPWGWTVAGDICDGAEPSAPSRPSLPFPVDASVNGKIVVWRGDCCSLDVDALVVPAASGYVAGASTVFPRVARHGGRDLRQDLHHLDALRSGEARLTKAYGLPCRWLLMTIGPKYKEKYEAAAQNTLNGCYRESFQQAVEAELRTLAIPCLWYHRGYPREQQAHVTMRTVRRCLERMRQSLDLVVMVAATAEEAELYEDLLQLYFPRTWAEAQAGLDVLPAEGRWSEWGDVAVEERRIRLASHFVGRGDDGSGGDDDPREDAEPLFDAREDADRSFLDARSDADLAAVRRLDVTMCEAESQDDAAQACLRYLRRAKEVRNEPDATRFVYRAPGRDRYGRCVVVLLGARLPSLGVRDRRTLPLFVKELELLGGERFVLFYANSAVSPMDTSNLEVLQEMLAVVSARYRGALDQLFVLHPGLWFRAAFVLGRAVSDLAASVWHDTVYLETISDVGAHFAADRLGLPGYVYELDAT